MVDEDDVGDEDGHGQGLGRDWRPKRSSSTLIAVDFV